MPQFIRIFALIFLLLSFPNHVQATTTKIGVQDIINKTNANFLRIQDASADITLEYSLHLLGCGGTERLTGKGYYKSPYSIKAILNNVSYFVQGNKIRKIDEKGRMFYVTLVNAIDFVPGFNLQLIPHNFNLELVGTKDNQAIIKGTPKPGILKNVKEIHFHFDTQENLLRQMDIIFYNKKLSGKIFIEYAYLQGLWVPTGFYGKSAIELPSKLLVAVDINLRGKNIKINNHLPHKLFDAGF